jgi:hypothetical protein
MTDDEADRLQRGFADWADGEASCRALAVVGSWARGTARADSDLDLMMLTDQLGHWTGDGDWLRALLVRLGFTVTALELEAHGVARSWRAWLGAAVELEVTLADIRWAQVAPVDPGTREVAGDGLRPMVDKDGLLRALQEALARP